MPFIQIKPQHGLTPEIHKEIKLQAIKEGKTIPVYCLNMILNKIDNELSPPIVIDFSPVDPVSLTY